MLIRVHSENARASTSHNSSKERSGRDLIIHENNLFYVISDRGKGEQIFIFGSKSDKRTIV